MKKLQKENKSDSEVKKRDMLNTTENPQTEAVVKVEVEILKYPAFFPQILTENITWIVFKGFENSRWK